ncbi:hypothetical protein FKP32DRAFT_692154 [Trametes sanguinea]|nr:hypothetical protein FKP32DRAFT_692154 [Trametes sanguinea]
MRICTPPSRIPLHSSITHNPAFTSALRGPSERSNHRVPQRLDFRLFIPVRICIINGLGPSCTSSQYHRCSAICSLPTLVLSRPACTREVLNVEQVLLNIDIEPSTLPVCAFRQRARQISSLLPRNLASRGCERFDVALSRALGDIFYQHIVELCMQKEPGWIAFSRSPLSSDLSGFAPDATSSGRAQDKTNGAEVSGAGNRTAEKLV